MRFCEKQSAQPEAAKMGRPALMVAMEEIKTPQDWENAADAASWFHDAVVRSVAFVNDERVDSGGAMHMGRGESTLRVVVQTQDREQQAVMLTFHGVVSFSFSREIDVELGEAEPVKDEYTSAMYLRFPFIGCEVVAVSATLTRLDWQSSEQAVP